MSFFKSTADQVLVFDWIAHLLIRAVCSEGIQNVFHSFCFV